ncbi:response regulator [Pseudobutyrivibrio sp.]|uniref:response regulator n=1 Tax=Pseudobutyrivibrio sp. TaxID=2014367 RepID=UPI001B67BAB4|nr:response regulator [Pseudobutyrivibrio sp.]MBP3261413.1 response regulator [Pseudobutyrivibrio sp.]
MEQVLKDEDIRKQKKRILIVDDDGTMLRTIKSWLDEDYYVFMVNSGVDAITFLATNEVDLILLDYEMPITTGPQVLEMLRSEKKTSKIPVIFLTNKRDKESVMNVLDLKPEGYLLKTRGKFALLTQLSEFFEKEKAKDY